MTDMTGDIDVRNFGRKSMSIMAVGLMLCFTLSAMVTGDDADALGEDGIPWGQVDGIYYKFLPSRVAVVIGFNPDLTTVDIPLTVKYNDVNYSVKQIALLYEFDLSKVENLVIPVSVTKIYSMQGLFHLKNLYMSDGIIVPSPFLGYTPYMENITLFPSSNPKIVMIDRTLYSSDMSTLIKCLKTDISGPFDIPETVSSIEPGAFYGRSSLTSITIPEAVTSIGGYTFGGCTNLASVTIPDSVASIGKYAFYYCKSLTSITIPNSINSIGEYAFMDCTNLATVYNLSSLPITAGSSGCGYVAKYATQVINGPTFSGGIELDPIPDKYLVAGGGTVFTVGSNVAITLSVSAPEGLTASVNGTVVTVSGDISGTYALTITASAEGMDDVTVEVPCTVVLRLQLLNLPSNGTLEWIQ